ncbi:MAG: hypothetical protein ACK5SQ_05585 [Chitinophagales bacterium]|jgi:hypothetical protein
MKQFKFVFTVVALALFTLGGTTACKAKYGCEANEQVKPRTNKKGELIGRKRSDHGELFDKKRRKKMGR